MSESFRFTAAACGLAQAILRARVRAYDLHVVDWNELSVSERQRYIDQAADIIRVNAPTELAPSLFERFVSLTREHAADVLKFRGSR